MRRMLQVGTAVLMISAPAALAAQVPSAPSIGIGIAPHVGTLGLGVDIGISLSMPLGVRAGTNVTPLELNLSESGVDYTISFPSPQHTIMVDLSTPVGFRATAGLLISPGHFEGFADNPGSIDLNGTTYSLTSMSLSIENKDVSPYLGIGWGSPGSTRIGFFTDIGVAFQGSPSVVVDAMGTATSLPGFSTNLESERQQLESDISEFKYFPVISLGITIGL